jgi:sugar lactone lactonase YvrE
MSNISPMLEPKVLLDGLAYVESPRWHDGRLWFAHWGTGEIVAVDLAGKSEVVGHRPPRSTQRSQATASAGVSTGCPTAAS